jgi:hypothetical protein
LTRSFDGSILDILCADERHEKGLREYAAQLASEVARRNH